MAIWQAASARHSGNLNLASLANLPPSPPHWTNRKLVASLPKSESVTAFKFAANRWLLAGPATLADTIHAKLKRRRGLIDLTHGRTALRISGPKAEWVLSKLYAIDFSPGAFAVGTGLSTAHHSIFTQIYRRDAQTFDLFVFRSFARSFWHTLQRAAEETGYEVA